MATHNKGKRNWSELSVEEWDTAIAKYEDSDHVALAEMAKQLGTSVSTLERQIRATRLMRDRYQARALAGAIPESTSRTWDTFTKIEADDVIIVSDIEVPDHDPRVLVRALLAGMTYGIRKIILAGDVIATDQDALNSWLTTWAEDGHKTYEACLDELKMIVRALFEWFNEGVYGITGNHDERVARKTGGQITLPMLLGDTPVDYSMYSYMYIHMPSKDEWVYVCHQYHYSKTPVRLAQDIWAVETAPDGSKRKMHVVITHTHIEQTGWSPDGEWRCISMGCARDPKKTKYARARATKFPKWNQGFVMIKDGYFHPLTIKGTDWKAFLGEELYGLGV